MGWLSIYDPKTGKEEVLGDVNQYRRNSGLPHINTRGDLVSEEELTLADEMGE